jgi:hypothetical protein
MSVVAHTARLYYITMTSYYSRGLTQPIIIINNVIINSVVMITLEILNINNISYY